MVDASIVYRSLDAEPQGIEIVEVGQHAFYVDQAAVHVVEQCFPSFHRGAYYRPQHRFWAIQLRRAASSSGRAGDF